MKLCSNVCNRCRLVCKILFKLEQICSCCCKMLRAHFFGDTRYNNYRYNAVTIIKWWLVVMALVTPTKLLYIQLSDSLQIYCLGMYSKPFRPDDPTLYPQ